ncbi:hypothetical protein A1O7_02673 [Cladophialophora yegresii CBS 114405]|uniref:Copper acquisition factor BIM1-like domain-containing protein n=1 Tax=Cladophialophora yegresii CBS 114405 TaxID=1182544 RepID=W9WB68_9EURO|nr:uncharacterized protein A1O7_02673 [Cladophialophora yegresii CBS 114405]EXJ62240.1 hypothetical protein A1O7_02673 [Cladophialophora yegresii CBS 114405]
MRLYSCVALLSAWTLSASAHFILQYPNSLGFSDDDEGTSPCGGFDVTFGNNDSSVPVGGFPVSVLTTHPASDFLFRATLDQEPPFNFTNLLPVVSETGIGEFCLPALVAPADFAGKPGVIQVIQNGPDGTLYQCAAVNFVSGMNNTVGASCTNVTGLTATITNQNDFDSSPSSSASGSASGTASPTASGGATSSSSPDSAAVASAPRMVMGVFGAVALAASFLL